MNIIPRIICCQKISGDLGLESSWQNVGQARTIDYENSIGQAKLIHIFALSITDSAPFKYGPRWKRIRVLHYLPRETRAEHFLEFPAAGLHHNNANVLRHSFHL